MARFSPCRDWGSPCGRQTLTVATTIAGSATFTGLTAPGPGAPRRPGPRGAASRPATWAASFTRPRIRLAASADPVTVGHGPPPHTSCCYYRWVAGAVAMGRCGPLLGWRRTSPRVAAAGSTGRGGDLLGSLRSAPLVVVAISSGCGGHLVRSRWLHPRSLWPPTTGLRRHGSPALPSAVAVTHRCVGDRQGGPRWMPR
jgi:hypothetical protein